MLNDPLVAKTAEGDGITLAKTPNLSYHVLQLNARNAPLDNMDVRLAIQCAIDRQQVLDTAALGEGAVVGPITSPAYKSDPNVAAVPDPGRGQGQVAAGPGRIRRRRHHQDHRLHR